jgi:hypothetical protein
MKISDRVKDVTDFAKLATGVLIVGFDRMEVQYLDGSIKEFKVNGDALPVAKNLFSCNIIPF